MMLPFLFLAREALIMWVRIIVAPFEIAFDAIEGAIEQETNNG